MRPKSILAVVLSISMLFAIPMAGRIFAADCIHSYEQTTLPATCISKEQILYTCSLCGNSYTVAADEPTFPDSCYILLESTKSEGQLIVTATLENNPGMYSMGMGLRYDASVLSPVSCINGDVWTDSEHWDLTFSENSIPYIAEHADMSDNTKNGLVCTLIFDILDDSADYGFSVKLDKRPFITWENQLVDVKIINVVGKGEYGNHSYEEREVLPTCTEDGHTAMVCIHCGDSMQDTVLPATGHQWTLQEEIISPTFESGGLGLYKCENCEETKEESLAVLEHWKKGDLNNDGILNMIDVTYMLTVVSSLSRIPMQMYDAADLDNNGIVNMLDYTHIINIAANNAPMPPGWE